jgi:hypothetical protein
VAEQAAIEPLGHVTAWQEHVVVEEVGTGSGVGSSSSAKVIPLTDAICVASACCSAMKELELARAVAVGCPLGEKIAHCVRNNKLVMNSTTRCTKVRLSLNSVDRASIRLFLF